MTPTPKKSYCFTLNNYTEDELAAIRGVCSTLSQYAIVGREVGEQGTRHLQGYIRFTRAYRFSTIKDRYLPRCHIEVSRGSPRQNRDYCSKDGEFDEYGELPEDRASSSREDLAREFARDATDGRGGVRRFAESNPGTYYFSGHNLLRNHWALQAPTARPGITVDWMHGLPGVGKSRRAHERLPDAYIKDPRTKWWNGYFGEKEVIIDDFGPQGIDINHLLRWFDRYKCTVEYKGGMMPLMAETFIVTSNYHPREVFQTGRSTDQQDNTMYDHPQLPALMRRINIIHMQYIIEYISRCKDACNEASEIMKEIIKNNA